MTQPLDNTPPPSADPGPPPVGILVLDKPPGVSSAGVLNRLKRCFPRGTKLGHAGTLDPFATGVLLALVGKATKRCEELMGAPKGYRTTVRLGASTATLDPESPEEPLPPATEPTEADVRAALVRLSGTDGVVQQTPPAFSAIKVQGRRAYDLARSGQAVELAARPVKVYRLTLLSYAYPDVELEMEVGRGFYVRSLARDLGAALGTAGYLRALRRTRVGSFAADDAVDPATLTRENVASHLKP